MHPPATRTSSKRAYDSPRRREQAQETRARIAEAARDLFLERGWAGTRVREVAERAGVAEPTVYATYGSKSGLALALLDAVDTAANVALAVEDLKAAAGDPKRQIAAMVGFDRRLFEGSGDVISLLSVAGRSEPELQAAYEEGRARGDRIRRQVFEGWPAATFRKGIDAKSATDMFSALCSVDVFRVLSEERGWSADEVERWWHESLVRLLLP